MFEPRPNQRLALLFALVRTHCAWWVQMGGGKTVCALSLARHWLHSFAVGRVLVVAPKRVAEETWPSEIGKWPHLAGLRLIEIRGTAAQRRAVAASEGDVYVVSRDNLPWLVEQFPDDAWRWDALVYDESSGLKRAGTQRFKALRRVQHRFARVLLLTGTPRPNSLLELWPQLWVLDRGRRLGTSMTRYKARWFQSDYHGYKWEPLPHAEGEIHEALQDLCISLDSDADLPEPDVRVVPVDLGAERLAEYRQFQREKILEARAGRDAIPAANAAVLVGKLAQYANGAIYDAEGQPAPIHDAKLHALSSAVTGEPTLVAYWFQHDLERIRRTLPEAETLDMPDAIARWNRGEIPVLLIHPASAGHGLNLQHGGRRLVWFGPIWSLELWQQTIARLHRTGQTREVHVRVIAAEGTIDRLILAALDRKDTGQKSTLDALRQDLETAA